VGFLSQRRRTQISACSEGLTLGRLAFKHCTIGVGEGDSASQETLRPSMKSRVEPNNSALTVTALTAETSGSSPNLSIFHLHLSSCSSCSSSSSSSLERKLTLPLVRISTYIIDPQPRHDCLPSFPQLRKSYIYYLPHLDPKAQYQHQPLVGSSPLHAHLRKRQSRPMLATAEDTRFAAVFYAISIICSEPRTHSRSLR